jgi:hypothetical protein
MSRPRIDLSEWALLSLDAVDVWWGEKLRAVVGEVLYIIANSIESDSGEPDPMFAFEVLEWTARRGLPPLSVVLLADRIEGLGTLELARVNVAHLLRERFERYQEPGYAGADDAPAFRGIATELRALADVADETARLLVAFEAE